MHDTAAFNSLLHMLSVQYILIIVNYLQMPFLFCTWEGREIGE